MRVEDAIARMHDRSTAVGEALGGSAYLEEGVVQIHGGIDAMRPMLLGCDLDVAAALRFAEIAARDSLKAAAEGNEEDEDANPVLTVACGHVQILFVGYLLGEAAGIQKGREQACREAG